MADENFEVMEWENVTRIIELGECSELKSLLGGDNWDELLRLRSTDRYSKSLLHFAVEKGRSTSLDTLLIGEKERNLQNLLETCDSSGNTPLQTAVKVGGQDDTTLVQMLLNAGADPTCRDNREKTAVQLAFESKHYEVLRLLLSRIQNGPQMERFNDMSFDLLQTALTISQEKTEDEKEDDAIRNLELLYSLNPVPDINKTNPRRSGSSRTALRTAFDLNHQRVMVWLLKRGACINFDLEGKVLEILTADKMADLLDNSISLENSDPDPNNLIPSSTNSRLKLDYNFLMSSSGKEKQNECKPLMFICRDHRFETIQHPLFTALVTAKWSKLNYYYTRYRYIKSFMSFICALILTNYTSNELATVADRSWNQTMMKWIITFIYTISGVLVLCQVFFTCILMKPMKLRWSRHPAVGIVLELVLVYATLVLMGCWNVLPVTFRKHLAAWLVMTSWFHFIITIGRSLYWMKIFVSMLLIISLQLMKIVFLCSFLFVAFSGSFSLLLRPDQDNKNATNLADFTSPWMAFPRVVAMATGEFGYSGIRDGLLAGEQVWSSLSAILLFMVFVFFVYLVIMNVMTGVAMVEAQEIKQMDCLNTLQRQIEVAYLLEEFLVKYSEKISCEKQFSEIQLFNNSNRQLEFWLNRPSDMKISYFTTAGNNGYCSLDEETATSLRTDLLQHLEEKKKRMKGRNSTRRRPSD